MVEKIEGATMGTQDTGRRQTKSEKKQKTKMLSNTDLTKNRE